MTDKNKSAKDAAADTTTADGTMSLASKTGQPTTSKAKNAPSLEDRVAELEAQLAFLTATYAWPSHKPEPAPVAAPAEASEPAESA